MKFQIKLSEQRAWVKLSGAYTNENTTHNGKTMTSSKFRASGKLEWTPDFGMNCPQPNSSKSKIQVEDILLKNNNFSWNTKSDEEGKPTELKFPAAEYGISIPHYSEKFKETAVIYPAITFPQNFSTHSQNNNSHN